VSVTELRLEAFRASQICGGCHPAITHYLRAGKMYSLFIRKAITVARPVGVIPIISALSSLQQKCSAQESWRGLNNITLRLLTGSMACVLAALKVLHHAHDKHRLSDVDAPPCASGMMCSMCICPPVVRWLVRQYSQQWLARVATRLLKRTEGLGILKLDQLEMSQPYKVLNTGRPLRRLNRA
jgi:hypothetical protein